MTKKLEFKDRDERKKCWIYAVVFSTIFTFIILSIWLVYKQSYDFLSLSIVFLIFLRQFYKINKFFIISKYLIRAKVKSLIYSILFLIPLSLIIVTLGKKSYPFFFNPSTCLISIIGILILFLVNVVRFFTDYLQLDFFNKRLTFLYWFYAAVFSIIVGFFLNFAFTILEFTIISSLIIGILCIGLFLNLVVKFNINKKKQVRALGFNLLILLISFVLGGIIYLWIVNKW